MALTFDFEKDLSPILGEIRRPVAKVLFCATDKKRWYEVWMIVDTGADYTLLPRYFAKRLDVDLKRDCRIFKTTGVGGQEKVYFLQKVRAKLGDWERIVPVGFLNRDNIPPLLGRHLFMETFEILFSKKHTITFSL